jgi:two-component system NtrC family response regulator
MNRYSWPGNIRELENRVRRAVIMTEGKRVTVQDLELAEPVDVAHAASLKEARETFDRAMILQALRKHSWKIAPVATELGISRPTLYQLMDKLGITKETKE